MGVILMAGAAAFLSSYNVTIMSARIERNIAYDLLLSAMNKDIAFFDENKTGDIMSRLTSDLGAIKHGLSSTFEIFMSNFIKITISIIIMSFISWKLTLALLGGVLPCTLLMFCFGGMIHKL